MSNHDFKTPEGRKAYQRAWYLKNRTRMLAKFKAAHEADKPARLARSAKTQRLRRLTNGDEVRRKANAWRKANPDRIKAYFRKYTYGLHSDVFNALLLSQDFKCAICSAPHSNELRGCLCVDHSHRTGKVRGLLCGSCNKLLGAARDKISTLLGAIDYLESNPATIILEEPCRN